MGNILRKPATIPTSAGVYIFKSRKGTPLYIGKARNLRKRLISYWRKDVSEKIRRLLAEAAKIQWIEAKSEIGALIQEAELIKNHHPKYNVLLRDDKNYFYVRITKERFPRVSITHQPGAESRELKATIVGPFTSGAALKTVLKLLRKIFPYCTCKEFHRRPCLSAQIGRCPGYCCLRSDSRHSNILKNVGMSTDVESEYKRNNRNIAAVLSGKRVKILRGLKKEMKKMAQKQEFEYAAILRNQIRGLENIFEHRHTVEMKKAPRIAWDKVGGNIQKILGVRQKISRVEGYDISNISGAAATGSMVVFVDGIPAKSEYRKFRIKAVHQISDVDMLKEVILRRIVHKEWSYPDFMLIDGGKPQLNAALSQLTTYNLQLTTRVAALAKREEELYTEGRNRPILLSTLPSETAFFFQRVRDESHRFAKRYHHKLREESFKSDIV